MKMTVAQHFTMFSTIADTIRSHTNLSEEAVADFAANITTAITEELGIEIEMTAEDEEFLVNGLMMAIIGSLME